MRLQLPSSANRTRTSWLDEHQPARRGDLLAPRKSGALPGTRPTALASSFHSKRCPPGNRLVVLASFVSAGDLGEFLIFLNASSGKSSPAVFCARRSCSASRARWTSTP